MIETVVCMILFESRCWRFTIKLNYNPFTRENEYTPPRYMKSENVFYIQLTTIVHHPINGHFFVHLFTKSFRFFFIFYLVWTEWKYLVHCVISEIKRKRWSDTHKQPKDDRERWRETKWEFGWLFDIKNVEKDTWNIKLVFRTMIVASTKQKNRLFLVIRT